MYVFIGKEKKKVQIIIAFCAFIILFYTTIWLESELGQEYYFAFTHAVYMISFVAILLVVKREKGPSTLYVISKKVNRQKGLRRFAIIILLLAVLSPWMLMKRYDEPSDIAPYLFLMFAVQIFLSDIIIFIHRANEDKGQLN